MVQRFFDYNFFPEYWLCYRTLQRTFSGRTVEEPTKGKYKRGGDFSYTNQSFSSLPEDFQIRGSENDVNSGTLKTPMGKNKCLQIYVIGIELNQIDIMF